MATDFKFDDGQDLLQRDIITTNITPRARISGLPLTPTTIATRIPVPSIPATNRNKSHFRTVCSNKAARNLYILLGIYYSAAIAGGIIIPVYGAYWFGGCISNDSNSVIVDDDDCDPDYSSYNLFSQIFTSGNGLLQLLLAGFFGRISDSYGRKIFILLAVLFYAIPRAILIFYVDLFLYFTLTLFMEIPSFAFSATLADIYHGAESLKTVSYSILFAMVGMGLFVGAAYSVAISGIFGNNHSVFISLGFVYIFLIIFWIFCIKETLSKDLRYSLI